MTVSVLLRLVAETLTEGRVAGHAEIVETGETAIFRDLAEMLAFLRRATSEHGAVDAEQSREGTGSC